MGGHMSNSWKIKNVLVSQTHYREDMRGSFGKKVR